MKGIRIMKITKNMDVSSKSYTVDKTKENDIVVKSSADTKETVNERTDIGASLSRRTNNHGIRTEEELNKIVEEIANKSITVSDAGQMVREANAKILSVSNEAVLAQANSSSSEVAELLS